MNPLRCRSAVWLLSLGLSAAAALAQQPTFPTKAVTIVVPLSNGGPSEVVMRPLAERLSRMWGQPVVIDNKPGANGIVGTQAVLRAPGDGHTILMSLTGMIQNVLLYKNLAYDPLKDFKATLQIGTQPLALAVAPSTGYTSTKAILAAGRDKSAKLSYGSFGAGSTSHIYGELFNSMGDLGLPHAAYKGENPFLTDLMSGRVTMGFVTAGTAVNRGGDKSLRVLAVTGHQRLPGLPDVATLEEQGYKGFEQLGWWGFFLPASTPDALVARISADLRSALSQPEMTARLQSIYLQPTLAGPAEFSASMAKDLAGWATLINKFGIQLEQ